jgi:hypothetical protein
MWPFINGRYLSNGVDIKRLPDKDFLDVLEHFFVMDMVEHAPPEEQEQRKDRMRAEIMRYNGKTHGLTQQENDSKPEPIELVEPNSDGYFPGFEDGFVG